MDKSTSPASFRADDDDHYSPTDTPAKHVGLPSLRDCRALTLPPNGATLPQQLFRATPLDQLLQPTTEVVSDEDTKSDVHIISVEEDEVCAGGRHAENPHQRPLDVDGDQETHPKRRKTSDLTRFMSQSTSSIAFARFDKLLDDPSRSRSSGCNVLRSIEGHDTCVNPSSLPIDDAYPCRPFQGVEFDFPEDSCVSTSQTSAQDAPLDGDTKKQLEALATISARIDAASRDIRDSQAQLDDAHDRLKDIDSEIEKLADTFRLSWEAIRLRHVDAQDGKGSADPTSFSQGVVSFAFIEAQLKELTRKKGLIETEINQREAKRERIDSAVRKYLIAQEGLGLGLLEDAAEEYVPRTTDI
ncbi:hypothetical protein Cob_v007955 [Colletotrichum orbiculare MAFF 240422]|uniref:Uncharacterized protein n=1 Tax=Colletotrichum orbiculare (strain 104-T / ATCC 96160 / CBS 514.97 / LARS 414 / MAFF 240422) TaxID=1213857 RepID=N4VMM3_COLOR|nr:hypothetical protein Cob_v007955 [Colletotrichum orbiculare MAFF 240422]